MGLKGLLLRVAFVCPLVGLSRCGITDICESTSNKVIQSDAWIKTVDPGVYHEGLWHVDKP